MIRLSTLRNELCESLRMRASGFRILYYRVQWIAAPSAQAPCTERLREGLSTLMEITATTLVSLYPNLAAVSPQMFGSDLLKPTWRVFARQRGDHSRNTSIPLVPVAFPCKVCRWRARISMPTASRSHTSLLFQNARGGKWGSNHGKSRVIPVSGPITAPPDTTEPAICEPSNKLASTSRRQRGPLVESLIAMVVLAVGLRTL
jgi:hypothetical protein